MQEQLPQIDTSAPENTNIARKSMKIEVASKSQAKKLAQQLLKTEMVRILVDDERNGVHKYGIHTYDTSGKTTLVKGGPTLSLAFDWLVADLDSKNGH